MREEPRSCYGCGHVTYETVSQCPRCGQQLRAATHVRRLGWVLLVIGLFLVGLMGTITYNVAPLMLRAGEPGTSGASFTGTWEQALVIFGLFGLVIMFGLASIFSGLWQIATGRRNKWIFIFMLGLFFLLLFAAWFVRAALGG